MKTQIIPYHQSTLSHTIMHRILATLAIDLTGPPGVFRYGFLSS